MFKGAIAENYIAEELNSMDIPLIYWKSKGNAKIDFLLTTSERIIPIEVKASKRTQSKSLNVYIQEYKPKYARIKVNSVLVWMNLLNLIRIVTRG